MMHRQLYVNGRFLAQPLSGVQRFATEMTAALRRIHQGPLKVLVPSDANQRHPDVHAVGRRSGHVWEQLDLPRHVKDGVLVNLGNTGPLLMRRQIIVLHDAGVFSTPQAYSRRFRSYYKTAQWWIARNGAQIVTVSEFSRAEIVRCLGLSPDSVAVVSEGSDHMDGISAEPDILHRNGLERGRFILVVGNLAAHKNLIALGELARQLAARDMPLVVAGGLPQDVFRDGDTARLPRPARYLGRVSDGALKALYQAAICFVFPSLYEGFGLPAVEAMACGCPVVAADIPGLRETCRDGVQYCDPRSPGDIATQVGRVIDDLTLRETLSRTGRLRAAELTWDRAARNLERVVQAAAR